MKKSTKIILALFLLIIFLLINQSPFMINIGLPFGYYGEYNRIKFNIIMNPNLRVVDNWLHKDLTLEDFDIQIKTKKGNEFVLSFIDGYQKAELLNSANGLLFKNNDSLDVGWYYYYQAKFQICDFGQNSIFENKYNLRVRNLRDFLDNVDTIYSIIKLNPYASNPYGGGYDNFIHANFRK